MSGDCIHIRSGQIHIDAIPPRAGIAIELDDDGCAVGLMALDSDGFDHEPMPFPPADSDGRYWISWTDLIARPVIGPSQR